MPSNKGSSSSSWRNSVCFALINQRSSNTAAAAAAAATINQGSNKTGAVVVSKEPNKQQVVDDEDPKKNLFQDFVKGKATSVLKEASKGLSSMCENLKASSDLKAKEPNKQVVLVVDEDPKNFFSKIGKSTFISVLKEASNKGLSFMSGVLKAFSDLKAVVVSKEPTNKFDDEEEEEVENLFLKIVKVIGKGTSGIRAGYEPEPALNLATYRGDRNPVAMWFARGTGMYRKYTNSVIKFYLGVFFLFSGIAILTVLGDQYNELASDSDSD